MKDLQAPRRRRKSSSNAAHHSSKDVDIGVFAAVRNNDEYGWTRAPARTESARRGLWISRLLPKQANAEDRGTLMTRAGLGKPSSDKNRKGNGSYSHQQIFVTSYIDIRWRRSCLPALLKDGAR